MPYSRKYDFKNGQYSDAEQIDDEFNQLIAAVNNIEAADNSKDAALRKTVQMQKITADDGGVQISANKTTDDILNSILNAGTGLHTFYAVEGSKNLPPSGISIRGVAQLTTPTFGWVWCVDYRNQMWTNYLNNSVWNGWKKLSSQTSEDEQGQLWSGAVYPDAGQTIKPTKKLSECQTGWILIWSDYDYGVGANDFQWAFSYVPKKIAGIDKGGSVLLPIDVGMDETTVTQTAKSLYINDADITGANENKASGNSSNDVCLRYVFEF